MSNRIESGDVIFRRVRNGWLTITVVDDSLDGEAQTSTFDTFVYEDKESSDVGESHSLLSALREQFDGYFQSKHRGGILALVREQGRSSGADAESDED